MTEDTSSDRDHNGRFTREPDTVTRDAEALRLRARGRTYGQIAAAMGYGDRSAARKAVERGLTETIQEAADEVRQLELERLDRLTAVCWNVLERDHVTVSHGRVVEHEGKPLLDDGPVLQAVDRLLKIAERRSRLLGLDAPQKQEIGGQLTYSIVGIDVSQL